MQPLIAILLSALLVLPGAVAWAQDAPPTLPTRDVVVTYRVGGDGQDTSGRKVRLTFIGVDARVRLDMFAFPQAQSPYLTLLYDRPGGRYLTLGYAQRAIVPTEAGAAFNPGRLLSTELRYTRQDAATVLDLACTNWAFSDADNGEGTACVTDDGVVLRLSRTGKQATRMEATSVEYGTAPDSLFVPPPDLQLMQRKPPG